MLSIQTAMHESPVFSSLSALLISCLFDYDHPTGVEWHCTVVLMCISLVIKKHAERYLMCLLAICTSSEKCGFRSLPISYLGYLSFIILL